MPTGGGKSLCYQLPAIVSEGTAIVVSPLIALMKNQVDAIRGFSNESGIAHFLNSSLNKSDTAQVKKDVLSGKTKLLYIAPETLTKEDNISFFKEFKISFFAIDEAHCISEWGHDFRPEYRRLRPIIEAVGNVPVIALTATATPKVQQDIQKNLGMLEADLYKSSFNRDNLYYDIRAKQNVNKEIIKYVKNKEKMAKILGKENMYQLSSHNVMELIVQSQWSQDPKKQEEMFKLLGTDIINKLSDDEVHTIIPYDDSNEEDLMKKYKAVNLIIKYKTKLTGSNVFHLIQNSENREKTAEILGTDNTNKLSASYIVELLSNYKCNVEEMAKILGKKNIDKINGLDLYNLVYIALSGIHLKRSVGIITKGSESLKNSNEILKALGPKNIAKLSDDNVKYFIDNAKDPEEMGRILGKENFFWKW